MGKSHDPDDSHVAELLITSASQHGRLAGLDRSSIRDLPFRVKLLKAAQDVVRQGDRPDVAVFVVSGMLARYHMLASGERQYLSFHIAGDMPDLQSLFLDVMDHSLCALGPATIALYPHAALHRFLHRRPSVSFALWRLTLVDAAIFRQAITNKSRPHEARLAHLLCEQFYRAKQHGLTKGNSCDFPVSQVQISQALGMSHISVNRTLQHLRRLHLLDLRHGKLTIEDWPGLVRMAGFDPHYLHEAAAPTK